MTGPAAAVLQLAWRNVRRHPGTGLAVVLVLAVATTTLTLGLTVRAAADAPWERTFRDTRGAHVVADASSTPPLTALAGDPEVARSAGPWPFVIVGSRLGGRDLPLRLVGRDSLDSRVDRPVVTKGRGDLDGVVLERSLADALGIRVGQTVVAAGLRLRVTGIGVSVSQPPFPATIPGLAWTDRATVQRLAAAAELRGYQLQLRLVRPGRADAFASAHVGQAVLSTSRATRAAWLADVRTTRVVLLTVSLLLVVLTTSAVAVVVAAGLAPRLRQVGALKAVGMSSGQVGAVVLVEYLTMSAVAALVGLVAGSRLAPALAGPGAAALGGARAATPGWAVTGMVVAMAAAVTAGAAVRPAFRAARRSTVRSLGSSARPPRPATGLARVATAVRLPLPVALGARSVTRRPTRSLLAGCSVVLGVTIVVAAMAMERTFQVASVASGAAPAGNGPGLPPVDAALIEAFDAVADQRLRNLVFVFTAVFVFLAALNLSVVAAFLARDQAANHAVLRAVGFTRRQTTISLAAPHAAVAAAAGVVGVPLGLLVFRLSYQAANDGPAGAATPPLVWLLLVPIAAAAVAAALAAVPANLLARSPIAGTLAAE